MKLGVFLVVSLLMLSVLPLVGAQSWYDDAGTDKIEREITPVYNQSEGFTRDTDFDVGTAVDENVTDNDYDKYKVSDTMHVDMGVKSVSAQYTNETVDENIHLSGDDSDTETFPVDTDASGYVNITSVDSGIYDNFTMTDGFLANTSDSNNVTINDNNLTATGNNSYWISDQWFDITVDAHELRRLVDSYVADGNWLSVYYRTTDGASWSALSGATGEIPRFQLKFELGYGMTYNNDTTDETVTLNTGETDTHTFTRPSNATGYVNVTTVETDLYNNTEINKAWYENTSSSSGIRYGGGDLIADEANAWWQSEPFYKNVSGHRLSRIPWSYSVGDASAVTVYARHSRGDNQGHIWNIPNATGQYRPFLSWEDADDSSDSPTGTEVTDWSDLDSMRSDLDGDYYLGNDLTNNTADYSTYNSGNGWSPIGDDTTGFSGTFDGNGYHISDLHIDRASDFQGLFGVTGDSAVIENVHIYNANLTTNSISGGLVGKNFGSVIDCSVTGAGDMNWQSGGVVGRNFGNVTESCADVYIYNSGSDVGGLVGKNLGNITQSYAHGNISLRQFYDHAGGLVGATTADSVVKDCYATGNLTGNKYIGGLIGVNDGAVKRCYSTGTASGTSTDGGLIASNTGTVTDSFWDTDTSGMTSSAGGTGKTSSQMKDLATFNDTATTGLTTPWDIVAVTEPTDWVDDFIGTTFTKFDLRVELDTAGARINDVKVDWKDTVDFEVNGNLKVAKQSGYSYPVDVTDADDITVFNHYGTNTFTKDWDVTQHYFDVGIFDSLNISWKDTVDMVIGGDEVTAKSDSYSHAVALADITSFEIYNYYGGVDISKDLHFADPVKTDGDAPPIDVTVKLLDSGGSVVADKTVSVEYGAPINTTFEGINCTNVTTVNTAVSTGDFVDSTLELDFSGDTIIYSTTVTYKKETVSSGFFNFITDASFWALFISLLVSVAIGAITGSADVSAFTFVGMIVMVWAIGFVHPLVLYMTVFTFGLLYVIKVRSKKW